MILKNIYSVNHSGLCKLLQNCGIRLDLFSGEKIYDFQTDKLRNNDQKCSSNTFLSLIKRKNFKVLCFCHWITNVLDIAKIYSKAMKIRQNGEILFSNIMCFYGMSRKVRTNKEGCDIFSCYSLWTAEGKLFLLAASSVSFYSEA
jgi:hypothetical protein